MDVCFYFQVHQPNRIRPYHYFDIGKNHEYEDTYVNREVLIKVANKCYLPTNELLYNLIKKHEGRFKVAFSISGCLIEQCQKYYPEVIASFKKLVDTGCVEILNETYNHSLSFLCSEETYIEEIKAHHKVIQDVFGYNATTFRNTELIYNNDIAKIIASLGYTTMLAEGADHLLNGNSANIVYHAHGLPNLKILLRNYPLSDDIAFRFANQAWAEYPLSIEKFSNWLHDAEGTGNVINLFMDYETFGEHQWEETGIFTFLGALPCAVLSNPKFSFSTPHEITQKHQAQVEFDAPEFYSWADTERDLSAWCGNHLQDDALSSVYRLRDLVDKAQDFNLRKIWFSLLTSDHFYYMCMKCNQDGDVHAYFSYYNDAYQAYLNFQNVVKDLKYLLEEKILAQQSTSKAKDETEIVVPVLGQV